MTHQSPKSRLRARACTWEKFPGPVRRSQHYQALRPEIASPERHSCSTGTSKLRGRTALSPVMRVIRHGGAEAFEPHEHGALDVRFLVTPFSAVAASTRCEKPLTAGAACPGDSLLRSPTAGSSRRRFCPDLRSPTVCCEPNRLAVQPTQYRVGGEHPIAQRLGARGRFGERLSGDQRLAPRTAQSSSRSDSSRPILRPIWSIRSSNRNHRLQHSTMRRRRTPRSIPPLNEGRLLVA